MAIGWTPKHVETIPLSGRSREHFLVLALEAAQQMNWYIGHISASGFMGNTNAGMFAWNADVKLVINEDTAVLTSASANNESFDMGRNKKLTRRYLDVFRQLDHQYTASGLDEKYAEYSAAFPSPAEDPLLQPPPTARENWSAFLDFFKPRKGYFFTPLLVHINMLVFVLMACYGMNIISPDNDILLRWGASFKPLTLDGQWWRLISNCFLHIGILHLLLNMYALACIGLLLEPYLGKGKFLIVYLLGGLGASITSLWWHDLTISAGASGAIFGLYGVFLAMLTTNLVAKETRMPLLASILVFVLYNLFYGLKGGIDNAAHIGGLLTGILIGYLLYPALRQPARHLRSLVCLAFAAVLIIGTSALVYHKLPNDVGQYDAKMEAFTALEQEALSIYQLPESTPADSMLNVIQHKGIDNWKQCQAMMSALKRLQLPEVLQKRVNRLSAYSDLRLQSCTLWYKSIRENTDQYNAALEACNKKIQSIIDETKKE